MADTVELTVRVENVEKGLERETVKREISEKYMHRLIEDVQARYHEISGTFSRIESAFNQHLKDDRTMGEVLKTLDSRLRTVERLAWLGVGGLAVVTGIITVFGTHMIALLK